MNKLKSNEEYFEFAKLLVVIPLEEIKKLFQNHDIKLPFYVHNFLLKETIRQRVFNDAVYNSYTDEQKFRLRGYDKYSIFALEKIIDKYDVEFDLTRYKELLFDLIFANLTKLNLNHDFAKELDQLKEKFAVDLEEMSYPDFYVSFKDIYYIENGYLDGMKITDFDEETLASYTLGDLKGLGLKYDVKVPRRINKAKLLDVLKAKFKLSDEECDLISKKSVLDLEIYAREKGFKISIDLKKRDMIEFIEFSLGMYHKPVGIDTFNYDIPLKTADEAALDDIEVDVKDESFIEEDVLTEPIPVEEDVEPIVMPADIVEEESEQVEPVEDESEQVEAVEEELAQVDLAKDESMEDMIEKARVEEPEPEIKEEPEVEEEAPVEEPVIEEPELEDVVFVDEEPEEVKQEEPVQDIIEDIKPTPEKPELIVKQPEKFSDQKTKDNSLLSSEEKELLDEKINQIIKKYYKKRRTRRTIWIIIGFVMISIIALAVYSYLYFASNGILPFGIEQFW